MNNFYGQMGLAETILTKTELACPTPEALVGHPGNNSKTIDYYKVFK